MNNVCYNNLFKLLIDKGLKKSDLARMCNLSSPTMAKLSKKWAQVSQQAMDRLDLPVNLASGVARMELLGNRSLYIDRHRGVLAYSTEAVDINAGTVVVRVRGEGLELAVMTDEELRINGVIRGVELVE